MADRPPVPSGETVFAGLTRGELVFCAPVLVIAAVVALAVGGGLAVELGIPAVAGIACGIGIAWNRSRRN